LAELKADDLVVKLGDSKAVAKAAMLVGKRVVQ
jgi:hypothetical protein